MGCVGVAPESALPPSGLPPTPYPTTTRASLRRKTAGRIAPEWTRMLHHKAFKNNLQAKFTTQHVLYQ